MPLPDQELAALIVVQGKLLNGHGFGPVAILYSDASQRLFIARLTFLDMVRLP